MVCVESVTVYPSAISIQKGKWYEQVYAEVCPSNATCPEVRWRSDNTAVATVNEVSGYIYANEVGHATIYAEAADGSGCCGCLSVTVSAAVQVSDVELNKCYLRMELGASHTLTATVSPSNATNPALVWTSNNPSVADVYNGVVCGHRVGYAVITATATDGSSVAGYCEVSVTDSILVKSVAISPSKKTMNIGDSTYLTPVISPSDATLQSVLFQSSNPDVATINPISGLLVAQAVGKTTISAMSRDGTELFGYCQVVVHSGIPVESINITPETLLVGKNDSITLYATILPNNATDRRVRWHSSNTLIATIDASTGEITPLSSGTTVMTATTVNGGLTADCIVTVDMRDKVRIAQDGDYFMAYFPSGNIWKSIGYDLSLVNSSVPEKALEHYEYNKRYDTYSEKELAFIYRMDPLGAEHFIRYYPYEDKNISLVDFLFFKDRIYKELYGTDPELFRVDENNQIRYSLYWSTITDSERLNYYSMAEVLFGMHPIFNEDTVLRLNKNIVEHRFKKDIESFLEETKISDVLTLIKALFFSDVSGLMSSATSPVLDSNLIPIFGWMNDLVNSVIDWITIQYEAIAPPDPNCIQIYNSIEQNADYRIVFVHRCYEYPLKDIINLYD